MSLRPCPQQRGDKPAEIGGRPEGKKGPRQRMGGRTNRKITKIPGTLGYKKEGGYHAKPKKKELTAGK